MYIALVVLHVSVAVLLILVVLLQSGKAGSIADVFGGGGSLSAFGARGTATALQKATTVLAITFMLTSLGMSLVKSRSQSIMQDQPAKQQAPAKPPEKK